MKDLLILVPAFKCEAYLEDLYNSVLAQSYKSWKLHIAVDTCVKSSKKAQEICRQDSRVTTSLSPQRLYALENIINQLISHEVSTSTVIGIIDGDDRLINPDTFRLIQDAYQDGANLAWTKYTWDDDDSNCVSNDLPTNVNPYSYPWVSSHFRTFGKWIFDEVKLANFKDPHGKYFRRAYDQALMLPMLYYCNLHGLKTTFIPEYCYRYNHENTATPPEEHTQGSYEGQLAQFIRKRGYIE